MTSSASYTLEVVEEKHLEDVARISVDFLNSKHLLCCVPLGSLYSLDKTAKKYRKHPEFMQAACVAIVPGKGVVGLIQVIFHGMFCVYHTAKEGEAFIDKIVVTPEARGMGIGSALMRWAEDLATKRGSTFMSLEVFHGNPAYDLYERKGYVVKYRTILALLQSIFDHCFTTGPVVCTPGSTPYCSYGRNYYMVKKLEPVDL